MSTTTKAGAPTHAQVIAAARVLAARHANVCCVDADDVWKTYSQDFIDDAQAALEAAAAAQEQAS